MKKQLGLILIIGLIGMITACSGGKMTNDRDNKAVVAQDTVGDDPTGNSDETTDDGDVNVHSGNSNGDGDVTQNPPPTAPPVPTEPPTPNGPPVVTVDPDTTDITHDKPHTKVDRSDFLPLAWENPKAWPTWNAKQKETKARFSPFAKEWSQFIYDVIEMEEPQLLNKKSADDIQFFCPNYYALSRAQRLNFWGELIVALAVPESSWNPDSQMYEKGMGLDPITKKLVRSEGLLQLSYQDERNYRIDCGFDWEKDKLLADKDIKKTILDPYNNLRCGIKILAIQLKKKKSITLKTNVYWAVIKIGGKYDKSAQISKATKAMKICQK